jgi:hypothetical protein
MPMYAHHPGAPVCSPSTLTSPAGLRPILCIERIERIECIECIEAL